MKINGTSRERRVWDGKSYGGKSKNLRRQLTETSENCTPPTTEAKMKMRKVKDKHEREKERIERVEDIKS